MYPRSFLVYYPSDSIQHLEFEDCEFVVSTLEADMIRLTQENAPNAPELGFVAKTTSFNSSSVRSRYLGYPALNLFLKSPTLLSETRLTVHPPHPAPVNRDPYAPDVRARAVSSSSSGHEQSNKSEQDLWDSFMSFPSARSVPSADED